MATSQKPAKKGLGETIKEDIGKVGDFFSGTSRYDTKDAEVGSAPWIRNLKQKDKDATRKQAIDAARKTPAAKMGAGMKGKRVPRY